MPGRRAPNGDRPLAVVSILAIGKIGYAIAARQSIIALLGRTDFEIHVTTDAVVGQFLPRSPRVHIHILALQQSFRADPFIGKFAAFENCLAHSTDDIILGLDADTVVLKPLSELDLVAGLGEHDLGMVEQMTIIGADMNRREFLEHFAAHSLAFLLPEAIPPDEAAFRFFNSGVIIARRSGLREFLDWASALRATRPAHHQQGAHMIADQDYFQVWANTLRPGSTAELAWSWNHCDKWDLGFVRAEARIAHFSNFCLGPEMTSAVEMRRLASGMGRSPLPAPAADLAIVIVTHNSATAMAICLDWVLELGYAVIVVDNASTDDTLAVCSVPGVQLVRNSVNTGFGAAANQGARLATAATLCFLNPDCLLTREAVDAALGCLAREPKNLVVPDLVEWDGSRQPGRQPAYSGVRLVADILHSHGLARLSGGLYALAERGRPQWYWPIGACIFARRDRFFELGGFDLRYFCYMEDVQLGREVYRRDGEVVLLPVAVPHFGAKGATISADRRRQLINAARVRYAGVNHSAVFATALAWLDAGLDFLRRVRRRLLARRAVARGQA